MNTLKAYKYLEGNLVHPIKVGKPAVFSSDGLLYHTSVVVALHEQTKDHVHFETKNTLYHLSLQPVPATAVSPFRMKLAACA